MYFQQIEVPRESRLRDTVDEIMLQKKPTPRYSLLNPFLEQQQKRNRKVIQIAKCSTMTEIKVGHNTIDMHKRSKSTIILPFINERLNRDEIINLTKDKHIMQPKPTPFDSERSKKNTNQINKYKYVFEDDIKTVKSFFHKKASSSIHFVSNTETDLSTIKAKG